MSLVRSPVRLPCLAGGSPVARRYVAARRNALGRGDLVSAVSGLWAHEQCLRLGASIETFLWCPGPEAPAGRLAEAVAGASRAASSSYQVSERTLSRLQPGASPPGLLSLVRVPRWQPGDVVAPAAGARLLLVADGVEYAGNLGALLRVVDACGAAGLVLSRPVARRTHPTVFTASRGTVLTVPTVEYDDPAAARRDLKGAGWRLVVATPQAATDYRDLRHDLGDGRPVALVVGSESRGVSDVWLRDPADLVSIPMRGRADSLNVATAAAVLLFDARHGALGADNRNRRN